MKHNKYWNTMWTDRDTEFYWTGFKFGLILSAIMVPCLIYEGKCTVKYIKDTVNDFREINRWNKKIKEFEKERQSRA